MDIKGIDTQIVQAKRSLSSAGNGDSAGAPKSSQSVIENSANSGSSQTSQTFNSLTDGNYIKNQIEQIMYGFPPFFPVGSPQRYDLIKGVNDVQDEINNSQLSIEVKDQLAAGKLTDESTDKEISSALEGVQQYTEEYSPGSAGSAEGSQQANIISIQI
jgi:hypothetical protein